MKNKRYHLKLLIFFFFIGVIYSCNHSSRDMYFDEYGSLLWVGEDIEDSAIKRAVHETLENSSLIVAQIAWAPEDSSFFKNIEWYRNLASDHGKPLMINIDWLKNDRSGTRGDWDFENIEIREQFKNDVRRIVETYKPSYLTLGVEVNYYALTNAEGYSQFINIFNLLKEKFEKDYPQLRVGLSFQLELLYGRHYEWDQTRTLYTLDAVVENLDYLALSTYPNFYIGNGFSLSLASIDSVSNSYNIPIGISETGIKNNSYSKHQREEYIRQVFQKFRELNLKFIIWGSMIDGADFLSNWEEGIGLLKNNGIPKPEFETWKEEIQKIKN